MGLPEHPDVQKAAEYRRRALDAAVRAASTRDIFVQKSWEYIASSYTEMADRLERRFRG
jgi:hypothetical protein